MVKADLNKKWKKCIESLTSTDIDKIISLLEATGVNRSEVPQLKAEIARSVNKNQVIARVLDAPGVLCEQLKGVIGKIIK